MSKKVDLHIHSYASDGQWSPQEILEHIDNNEIKMFAICDHDTVESVGPMVELTKKRYDIDYIKAVEISTTYNGIEHHILTYDIDETNNKLLSILNENLDIREDYNTKLIQYLSSIYPQVSVSDYKAYEYNQSRGGWRTFGYLLDCEVMTDIRDYFTKIKGFTYEKKFYSPIVMIPKLKALGYTTILAHPPAYTKGDLYDLKILDTFRDIGLDGIECYTQYLKDQKNSQYYVDYCHKHQLLITGGSDCHGGFAGRQLGYPFVTEDMISLNKSN